MSNETTRTNRIRTIAVTGAAVAALGVGGVVAAASGPGDAQAAGSTTTSTTAQRPTPPAPPNPAKEDARLAKALGVSEQEVKDARNEVRSQELAAAVKAKTVTSEQADLIGKLRATGYDVPVPPSGSATDPDEALAKALGVSVDKLRDARPAPPKGGPKPGPAGGPPAPGKNGAPPAPSKNGAPPAPSKNGAPAAPAAPGKSGSGSGSGSRNG